MACDRRLPRRYTLLKQSLCKPVFRHERVSAYLRRERLHTTSPILSARAANRPNKVVVREQHDHAVSQKARLCLGGTPLVAEVVLIENQVDGAAEPVTIIRSHFIGDVLQLPFKAGRLTIPERCAYTDRLRRY